MIKDMISIPRPEFPNPQFERKNWMNLNGVWGFEYDFGNSGEDRGLVTKEAYNEEIIVPFTYESELSGINNKDFCCCVWYKRVFILPDNWSDGTILLNFGAVDYHAKIWINGNYAGFHRGGMVSFTLNITKYLIVGENTITVRAYDDQRGGKQPVGKQSGNFHSNGCHYTRTTGVWQTVWLEHIPFESYIKSFKIYPDIHNNSVTINVKFASAVKNAEFSANILYCGKEIVKKTLKAGSESISLMLNIPLEDIHLWEIGKGGLYDLVLTYGADTVYSYFGLREVVIDKFKVLINGKSVFQRLVLDQGFYPDGTFTAPSDEALKQDILLSMQAGFNGARLHQKIFEPRFHYHADTLGYITWGEHGNWGMDYSAESYQNFLCEWIEAVNRDFNHPSIIGWCPFNETNMSQRHDDLAYVYRMTKMFDITRPVIDTSGYVHVETDIFDVHDYDQNPETFKARYLPMLDEDSNISEEKSTTNYQSIPKSKYFQNDNILKDIEHLPYFVSEFGGTWWSDTGKETSSYTVSWGYGEAPGSIDAFYTRFEALISALLDNPRIFAFCYTQLTDVEQEQNGIYYYNRTQKFDSARLYDILTKKAAIEE